MIACDPAKPIPALLNGLVTREDNALRKAAVQFGFEFKRYNYDTLDDLERIFASGVRDNVDALYITGAATLYEQRSRLFLWLQRRENLALPHTRNGDATAFCCPIQATYWTASATRASMSEKS